VANPGKIRNSTFKEMWIIGKTLENREKNLRGDVDDPGQPFSQQYILYFLYAREHNR
jgi:hypothetical protein